MKPQKKDEESQNGVFDTILTFGRNQIQSISNGVPKQMQQNVPIKVPSKNPSLSEPHRCHLGIVLVRLWSRQY